MQQIPIGPFDMTPPGIFQRSSTRCSQGQPFVQSKADYARVRLGEGGGGDFGEICLLDSKFA